MNRFLMNKKFHALLKEIGIESQRENLLSGFNAESLNDLSDVDLSSLIAHLEQMKMNKERPPYEVRKWRSNVITVLSQLGIYDDETRNWSDVNEYLLDNRIAGKLMYNMSKVELIALHRKLIVIKNKSSIAEAVSDNEKEIY
jgi:hypothetical protein